ncbi:hypothetical protein EG68_07291 [Paragonimus skrjabini miyazakii]|uniref:PMP-22/EMP/MP20/Claudin tight junction n=1 Tax=Paragonimus skrjabini miyazakii TaxID=59628 RepID=A0A8S9YSB2_9TREM|nr:hypothetical protein EG68_07291 [Paragonimus skrjabini miyazakii]
MGKDYTLTQMYMPFYAACVATTIGFFFFFLSFSSPYWLQSHERVHSSFLHMGVWQICFDRFVHPKDYHANVLTGCYWIFDRFFFKIGIWQWLDPYWLIAVQVLITIAFITKCCIILILILYHLFFGHPAAESTMAMSGQLFIGVLLTICAFIFGIKTQDRSWMPRPDQNFLSWSFGFIILAAISSFIAAGFLYCVSYTDRAAEEEVERFEAVKHQHGMLSMLSGRGGSASAFGQRSLYGGTQSIGGVVVKVPSTGTRPEQVLTLDSDLRRLDGGDGSASLFTPSLAQQPTQHQRPAAQLSAVPEDSSIPEEDMRRSQMRSPVESLIPSTYGSDSSQQPLYTNERGRQAPTRTHKGERRYSPAQSVEQKSYSPLEEDEQSQTFGDSEMHYPRGQKQTGTTQPSGYRPYGEAPRRSRY